MSNWEIKATPGTAEIVNKVPKHLRLHKKGMRKSLNEIGLEVREEDRKLIKSPPKTGRIYYIKKLKRHHQASAPGEAPANMIGKLARSAGYRTRNHQEMEVGERVPYAKFLEIGTKKMKPRPHLTKAVISVNRNAVKILEENGMKEIK